jgi:1-pyrroline-5-carboxylate dehydrogenase
VSLGEVEEAAGLLRYSAQAWENGATIDHLMGNLGDATVHTRSVLRPHGVFAVISPVTSPMAPAAGSGLAALIAGRGLPTGTAAPSRVPA